MNNKENIIRAAINNIIDPDLGKTLDELNAIKNINTNGSAVEIELELIQPVHWISDEIIAKCKESLKNEAPDIDCKISVVGKAVNKNEKEVLSGVKNIIAVSSGKGGVGKSAIAANIAAALSLNGAKVGIIDGDVYGPSQPTMFGLAGRSMETHPTLDGKVVASPIEKYGIHVASMGFLLNKDQAAIVRGPMLAGYFSLMFEQIEWPELDFLIFDLPPGTGDIQLTLTQKIPLTGAVVVTTPQEISVADVRRSIAMFQKVNVDILGIIENMSYFVPPDMPDKKYYIFGQGGGKRVAYESGIPFLGEAPLNINMREANDNGKPYVLHESSGSYGEILKAITSELVSKIRLRNFESEGSDIDISI